MRFSLLSPQRLIILVGKPGVGKTAIRDRLAEQLKFVAVGPDDFPNRWNDVYWRLDAFPCVLECCQIPRPVRRRFGRETTVIELTAPGEIRRERLVQQGHNAVTVEQRLAEQNGLGYEDPVVPDYSLETTDGPEVLAALIAERES